jgi:hypothetical protein
MVFTQVIVDVTGGAMSIGLDTLTNLTHLLMLLTDLTLVFLFHEHTVLPVPGLPLLSTLILKLNLSVDTAVGLSNFRWLYGDPIFIVSCARGVQGKFSLCSIEVDCGRV